MAKTNLTLIIVIIALALIFFNSNVTGNALYTNILNKYKVQGSLVSADCNQIKGYTCYPAASSMALTVYLQEGTSVKATSTANKAYPATSSCTQNHGFTITTPAALKDGRSHSLSVYALDPVQKVKVLISGSPKSILCASCTDNIKNQGESDIDCGGSICTTRCSVTQTCNQNSDCTTNYCSGGVCANQPPATSCTDGIKNQDETDIDCGGSTCTARCTYGQDCGPFNYPIDANCATGLKCLDTWPSVCGQNRKFVCGTIIETDGGVNSTGFNLTLSGIINKTAGIYSLIVQDTCINSTHLNETALWGTCQGYRIPSSCIQNSTTQCSAGRCI